MKKMLALAFGVCFITAAYSQKTINDADAEVRKVTSFHAVEVSGGIDLLISNGDEALAISAKDAETRSRIKTEVKDGILKIWYEWNSGMHITINSNKALKAYVSYRTLDKLTASGGSDVSVDGTLNTNDLALHLSGGSDFKGKVDATQLQIHQSGGSDVHISGMAQYMKVDASGGSDLNGYDMITQNCDIVASGGSDIDITVNKELSAEATGASDVSWKGSATVKKAKASGAGSVSHKS